MARCSVPYSACTRVRHLDNEKICASYRIFLRGIRDPEFDSVQRKTRKRRASAAAGRACLHFNRGRIFVRRRIDPDSAQSGSRVARVASWADAGGGEPALVAMTRNSGLLNGRTRSVVTYHPVLDTTAQLRVLQSVTNSDGFLLLFRPALLHRFRQLLSARGSQPATSLRTNGLDAGLPRPPLSPASFHRL